MQNFLGIHLVVLGTDTKRHSTKKNGACRGQRTRGGLLHHNLAAIREQRMEGTRVPGAGRKSFRPPQSIMWNTWTSDGVHEACWRRLVPDNCCQSGLFKTPTIGTKLTNVLCLHNSTKGTLDMWVFRTGRAEQAEEDRCYWTIRITRISLLKRRVWRSLHVEENLWEILNPITSLAGISFPQSQKI